VGSNPTLSAILKICLNHRTIDRLLPPCYPLRPDLESLRGVKNVEIAIYTRTKNGAGQWRYHRVKMGRGVKTGTLAPPFYFRLGT
jgi:hypothetical protein